MILAPTPESERQVVKKGANTDGTIKQVTHGNPSPRKRKDHTTHDMVFHLMVKGHMPGVGE